MISSVFGSSCAAVCRSWRSGLPDYPSDQRVGEFCTARILELEGVREGGGELGSSCSRIIFLARWRRDFTVSSGMPRDDAVSFTLSSSTMRITNTTRNGSGRSSIARSSRSRTWLRAAVASGSIRRRCAMPMIWIAAARAFDRIQRNDDVLSVKAIDGLVHHDACQPRREACIRTEFREIRERTQIRFLHHVFGFAVVAHDRPCDPIEPLIVTPNDQAQRRRTSLSRDTHEFGIDEPGQLQLRSGLLQHAH